MTDHEYLTAARAGKNEFWRYFITIVVVIVLTLTAAIFMAGVALIAARGPDITKLPLPLFLAINLAPFGMIIAGVWIGQVLLHQRPWMALINPVAGRFSPWRFFAGAGLWLAMSAAADLTFSLLQPGNYVFLFNPQQFVPYLVVALLLIPIQAGAEELMFRGYLTQASGLVGGWWAAWLVPSVLFGLLHGVNPEVGAYGVLLTMPLYIGLGLLFGWVTLRSKSLELALGMHIANNLYAALLVGYPSAALPSGALFQIQQYDALMALIGGMMQILLFVLLFELFLNRTRVEKQVPLALITLLLAGSLAGCALNTETAGKNAPGGPSIALEDCSLKGLELIQIKAQCGTLTVPENREDPNGRKIALRVVVARAVSRAPAPDPLFMLAGGPGQAASEAFTNMIPALERLRFQRDVILVDQRGTGQSNPLDCADPDLPDEHKLQGIEVPLEETLREVERCRAALPGDPRFYTTDIAMQDLDEVRQALGYPQINLLGVSYGTRAALAYQRLYPERTRSLILDGVVPPDWHLGAYVGPDAQRALEGMFERCQAEPQCKQRFPNLRETFQKLIEQARQQPVEVELPHPSSGRPTQVRMTPLVIGNVVRLMTYSDILASLLPLAIDQAGQGDYSLLASQYLQLMRELDEGISYGMYYSVLCAEDAPYLPDEPPADDSFVTYDIEHTRAICQAWLDQPPAPPRQNSGSASTPVLIISGELDPVTPPQNGDRVAALFPNSHHLVLPGLGHSSFYIGCVPDILFQFIQNADPTNLDTGCTAKLLPAPFFLNPAGSKP